MKDFTEQWRRRALKGVYMWANWKDPAPYNNSGFVCMVDTAAGEEETHHFIVTEEADGLLVSALTAPKQNKDSYVEVMVKEGHPLYERIQSAVGVLNIAGFDNEIEGVGEAFKAGVYHVVVNAKEHAAFVENAK